MKLSELTKKRIRLAYAILLSLLIVVTGVLFALSCYSINSSGEHPFTLESVGAAFDKIKIPVFITIAALIGSAALNLIIPEQEGRTKPWKMNEAVLKRLTKSLKWDALSEDLRCGIERERARRLLLKRILAVLIILSVILPLIYLLNPNHFPAEFGQYNSEILHGILFYAIALTPLFVFSIVCAILLERSVLKETALVKKAIAEYGRADAVEEGGEICDKCALTSHFKKNKNRIVLGVRIALVAAAVVLITVGALSGGADSVLAKAVKICTECIGLG